ncbi:MAG: trigger factor [Faecalimonas sp.]|nr:trigger factor [Faecalimonas sp.]
MKKRIMALFLAMAMVVVATGCGKGYKVGDKGEVYNDYVKIKKWKELEVERVDPTPVTDEDVNMSIENDLQTLTSYVEVKDRGAQNGDQVTIDYVGKVEGKEFQGGTDSDYTFILGEVGPGKMLEDFQKGIVGHKAGEAFEVAFTFPKDYGVETLNGKAVVFDVTLDKVEEVVIPELNDETVAKLSDKAKTVDEYKAQVKADLEKSNKESAEAQMKANAFSAFMEKCKVIEYPKERLEETIESCTEMYTEQLEQMATMYYGTTLEELKKSTGKSEEDLLGKSFEDIAEEQLLCELAIELIQKVEKLDFSDKAYEKFLEEQAELFGYEDGDDVEEAYEEMYGEDSFKLAFKQEKVAEFLYEYCKVVEPKATDSSETVTE